MLNNLMNYGYYLELAQTGYQTVYTKDITNDNIEEHFYNILNILSDGIETEEVQNMKIHVVFPDDELDLYIFQYMYNLMFWTLIVCSGKEIESIHLFFEYAITKTSITKYVNDFFIRRNIGLMDIISFNQAIDRCIGKFRDLRNYQMYLCNTLDFESEVEFMKKFPEYRAAIHTDISNVPIEDVKDYGMKQENILAKYIMKDDEDHCLKYAYIAEQGVNRKQHKEVYANIGSKPNGQGGAFAHAIPKSFINGGLQSIEDVVIDSSIGRIAQILQKQNVGQSGAFARRLGLNNQDSRLHEDPEYTCDTVNLQKVVMASKDIIDIYDMRWYREFPNGIDKLLNAQKDRERLLGKTLYFRSPMTCASAARGDGICYKCYGNLAHVNNNINIGQLAAELLSSIYTQTLLSAKHLLESAIIKLEWTEEFKDIFNVEFDQIVLKDNVDYRKMSIIINMDDIIENESDDEDSFDMEESNYVYSFIVRRGNEDIVIRTKNSDPIYIHGDLQSIMASDGPNDSDIYEISMDKLKGISLFTVDVQNDELSAVMKQVKNLIDNKGTIKQHDRHSILETFIDANLKGKIKINAVHFEVLLMNQIRDGEDILGYPDWTMHNTSYQIITLENSLVQNPSVTVRLQSPKLKKTITSPQNRRLYKPSNMDLFAMVNPQKFMSKKFESSLTEDEKPRKIIKPFHFINNDGEHANVIDNQAEE